LIKTEEMKVEEKADFLSGVRNAEEKKDQQTKKQLKMLLF